MNGKKVIKIEKSNSISQKDKLIDEIIAEFINRGAHEIITENRKALNV